MPTVPLSPHFGRSNPTERKDLGHIGMKDLYYWSSVNLKEKRDECVSVEQTIMVGVWTRWDRVKSKPFWLNEPCPINARLGILARETRPTLHAVAKGVDMDCSERHKMLRTHSFTITRIYTQSCIVLLSFPSVAIYNELEVSTTCKLNCSSCHV